MEKFLFVFKLSKGCKIIGWLKLTINSLFAVILMLGLIISRSFDDSLRKIFDVDKESNFSECYRKNLISFEDNLIISMLINNV